MVDALGQKIIVGQTYGYSKSSSGFTTVITGVCSKIGVGKHNKIQLDEVIVREYLWVSRGETKPLSVEYNQRKRTISSVICFATENIHYIDGKDYSTNIK